MISVRQAFACLDIPEWKKLNDEPASLSLRNDLCGDVFHASALFNLSLRIKLGEISGLHVDLILHLVSWKSCSQRPIRRIHKV